MKILRHLLLYAFIGLMAASCNPMHGRKAILVDDDGQSMRFDRNRQESKNKKWDARKKKNFKKNKYSRRD
ncbi:hypothetical protein [Pontibacter fetidus]|uniref:Lipoprotein n=1 Tax=Pontibacter fetidus TaxID=2700082 RepID=A0A6B2H1K3_9BACT|nr:hypothetical protein [Pontibacter fetidus]NDK56985.1 hypothetical protein [Pontibacter fetidus]